jgi:hypothetical protein
LFFNKLNEITQLKKVFKQRSYISFKHFILVTLKVWSSAK